MGDPILTCLRTPGIPWVPYIDMVKSAPGIGPWGTLYRHCHTDISKYSKASLWYVEQTW
jgi:hypothetical protein